MADSDSGLFGALPRRQKGIIFGGLIILWGIGSALFSYASDNSLDASTDAIIHVVIWVTLGVAIIAYYTIGAGGSRRRGADDDGERNAAWLSRNRESEDGDQRPY